MGVNHCLGAEHPEGQLFHGHFKGENGGRYAVLNCGMLRDIQCKRGFTHGRASRDYDKIRGLETGGQLVEFCKT